MLEYVRILPAQFPSLHLSKEELKEAIQIARQIKKDILEGKDYSRQQINDKLGIYKRYINDRQSGMCDTVMR